MSSDKPTTGSTSHLYPALLAVLYWAGAKNEALPTAAFFLDALVYLLFLLLYLDVVRLLAPESQLLAGWLCVLSGQTIFSALGQSDMGIFMVLSIAAFDAALRERSAVCGALLVAASWCRPEGAILSVMLIVVSRVALNQDSPRSRSLLFAGLSGVAGTLGVVALNYSLTGTMAFTSVLGKSPLVVLTLPTMVFRTCSALGGMILGVGFGVASNGREFYLLPIVGGILALIGLASRDWRAGRTARVEIWWWGSALFAVVIVAGSGWQGLAHDRYLAWILPIWILYCALGLRWLSNRFLHAQLYRALGAILLIYQMAGMAFFASAYAGSCARMQSTIQFARSTNARVENGCRVGLYGFSGIGYYMPNVHTIDLNGRTTREFARPYSVICAIETLKHKPTLRCDKWLISMLDRSAGFLSDLVGGLEDMEIPALRADASHGLFSAEWVLLDYPLVPLSSEAAGAVEGMRLVDILDIGFVDDERRCHYATYTRIAGAKISPTAKKGMISGREILDVGRVIHGYEAFRINCIPHRPLRIVLRLSHRVTAETDTPPRGTRHQDFEFGWPLELLVFVDEQPLDVMSFSAPTDSADFHDIVFDVPAAYIVHDTATISVGGDHASFGYWFYQ